MGVLHQAAIDSSPVQDARPSGDGWPALYEEAVLLIRRLYQECRLIHADLSEYNLLVHKVGFAPPPASWLACWASCALRHAWPALLSV